jgi:hypothetical protein
MNMLLHNMEPLNPLIKIEVIWITEPTWNMCLILYFSSVINSNKLPFIQEIGVKTRQQKKSKIF